MNIPASLSSHRYFVPTEIVFGNDAIAGIGEHVRKWGQRPLIVTGKRSARATGLLDVVLRQAPGGVVFDAIDENPDTTICEQGAAFCRESRCDVIIAIGGGSPIDAAKAIAVLATNDGACETFFGADKYSAVPLPIVAVPTTAGTGSEVTPYSVLVDPRERTKRTVSGTALFPRVAILDPELTVPLPRAVTIASGLDALSQAMEGIVSKKSTPMGDTLAIDAIRRVVEFLPRAANNGHDIDARAEMLYAAMLSGCIIAQSGTTLVHGMGYYYTIESGIAHGLANGLLLAPLFSHNARVEPERCAAIAGALTARTNTDEHGRDGNRTDVGRAIVRSLFRLFEALGVSPAAREHGVSAEQLDQFAQDVAKDPYRFRNQVGDINLPVIREFYEQSYFGSVPES